MPSRLPLWRVAVTVAATAACNEGLQPTPVPTSCPTNFVGICGTITFRGTVPGNTAAVYIVAYDTFPQTRNDLFKFQPPVAQLKPLPLDSASAFYTVSLPNGRYEWVVAAWVDTAFTVAGADTTLQVGGFYRDPSDTSLPGVVVVSGAGTDSINFVVDFSTMQRICTYVPPCP